jgi:peptidoglycan/xylan/chitin deacetylase (PgdA/CDA1 family)
MRILHILSQTEMTGAEVYSQNLVQSQTAEGHQVFLISEKLHVDLPIPWLSWPVASANRWQRLAISWKLHQLVKANKIQVIHCHSRAAVRVATWARRGTSAALVTTLHGRQHFSWSKRFFHFYGELLIAVCENVKSLTASDFKMHPDPIEVIGNPFADSLFNNVKSNSVSNSAFHLAFVGRSTGPKGEGFEKIGSLFFKPWLEKYPFLKITLIVPHLDGFSSEFRKLLVDLSQNYKSRFFSQTHVPRLVEKLPEFDLTIASGRVAIEALAQGRPVFAMGEADSHGIVRLENFDQCVASNFGDMQSVGPGKSFDWQEMGAEIELCIKSPNLASAPSDSLISILKGKFASSQVNQRIINIYQRAIFKRKHPQWLPILMYHKIPINNLESRHRIFVTQENFEKHLKFFKAKGFETLHFSEIFDYIFRQNSEHLTNNKPFPKKPLLLTFDDGYQDNLENAQPLLQKYQMKAHIYLLANTEIRENTWDQLDEKTPSLLMSPEQRKKLDLAVWEIGSHGLNHPRLPEATEKVLEQELRESKKRLETEFGKEVFSFAYPFGLKNKKIETATRDVYQFAVNTDQGGLHLSDNLFSLFRVNVFPEDGPWQLRKKCSAWYRRYFFLKRKR